MDRETTEITGDTKMSLNRAVRERIMEREVESQSKLRVVSSLQHPSDEEVRRRASQIHFERGGIRGYDLDDWLEAEKELTQKLHR